MKEKRYCSFCGKPEELVNKLITGQKGGYVVLHGDETGQP